MPYPLNNVATVSAYNDALTLVPPHPTHKLNATITNAAVFVQLERCDTLKVGAGVLLPEEFWVPGYYNITREWPIGIVKFRSAVVGAPARVSAAVATE